MNGMRSTVPSPGRTPWYTWLASTGARTWRWRRATSAPPNVWWRDSLRVGDSPRLIFGNSLQVGQATPYGRGKARATEILAEWAGKAGAPYVDVVFPNLYGEGGRPDYNSVVATFCYRLATGDGEPKIAVDRELDLLHAQDAAAVIIEHLIDGSAGAVVRPSGTRVKVRDPASS